MYLKFSNIEENKFIFFQLFPIAKAEKIPKFWLHIKTLKLIFTAKFQVKQDRFTTCFKTCGTKPCFFLKGFKKDHSLRVKNGAKSRLFKVWRLRRRQTFFQIELAKFGLIYMLFGLISQVLRV